MEGAEARCDGGDPMDFSWTVDGERPCAGPSRDEEAAPAPAPAPRLSPQELAESMILVSGPRVVTSGLRQGDCRSDDSVLFINAGGGAIEGCDSYVEVTGDSFFEGGDVIETNESIIDGGDCPSIYHSARYGSFSYKFDGLAPGDYFLDLHFAEIFYTFGPKGIRTFDVLVQDEKMLSQLDVYAVVGGNRPIQVRDIRVTVGMNGAIMVNFKGVRGSPMVSGICIRKAPLLTAANSDGNVLCKNCSSDIDFSDTLTQTRTSKLISKYEKQIEELTRQCTMKSDECYMAWSSVECANLELGRLKIELHQKGAVMESLEQALGRESDQLRNVSQKYENDKKLWTAAISNLERKIKAMKQEQALLSIEAHDCTNAIPDLNKMVEAVQGLVAQCEDLKLKYYEEMDKRKKLHNIVQETKGNIRVFCRCRPLSKDELSSGQKCVVDFDGANDGDIAVANAGATKKTFKFDRVFTPKDDQDVVYADASPLVTSVLDGYNVCIFAYGQTGTGKTFTMEGTERNRGVNYRTLEELFKIAQERKESVTYDLSVHVLEVYNEQIRDLLDPSPTKKLEIKQSSEGYHVPGLVEAKVNNIKEVWKVLQAGSNARAVGSNNVNEHSSRSHCMLCIMVRAKNLLNGECTSSKLWLVDLAGSERLAKTDVQGERLKEAQNINKSLSALGDVISALATKTSHIPYRNSKLTHLLQDSLGGDSKTLMFVQISPSNSDVSETLSSLNFASRVRRIELGPAKKQVDTVELQKTKQMLEKAKQEVRLKDDSLRKLEGKEQLCKNLQEKVKELEGQLDSKAHSQMASEKQQHQLSGKLKEKEEMCTALQQKIVELECKLRQPHQSESEVAVLKQMIKKLELKLKEQEHDRSAEELKIRIKDLERKLKEQEHQQSVAELKNKELELKLKELEHQQNEELELKLKELEHQRSVAELQAKEIGHELLETQRSEAMLQIKLRDLESKLKAQNPNMIPDSSSATPGDAKLQPFSRVEAMVEEENDTLRSSESSRPEGPEAAVNEKKRKGDARNASMGGEQEENIILRSSNSLNKQRPLIEKSLIAEAPEAAVSEKKRKGDARDASMGGGEPENNDPASGQNVGGIKRSLAGDRESRLKRTSTEPPSRVVKNLIRSTASSRAAAAAAAAHKVSAPSSRVSRQQPGGKKTTRGWVR